MKKVIIVFVAIVIVLSLFYSYSYIEMIPSIKAYGKMELERFNQMIVTHSYMTNDSIYNRFVNIERNDSGEISMIEFDMIRINELANDVVLDIESTYVMVENHNYIKKDDSYYEKRIDEVSKNGIISKISLATLMNTPIFYFVLPNIYVRYKHLSKVNSSVIKNVENYGLNHIMVEVVIRISMEHAIVYPFFEEIATHNVDIPILLEIYQGQIPLIYTNN